mgnify:CR=1 FL=1
MTLDLRRVENIDIKDPGGTSEVREGYLGDFSFDYFDSAGSQILIFGLTLASISIIQLVMTEKKSERSSAGKLPRCSKTTMTWAKMWCSKTSTKKMSAKT